ncbi:MAG: TAXI family TRAP transporter solute-binding subunit [Oscillospiraceae bacterium]|nr:TAXI family TRAP transporter solute-binding subunit [Oscillospiraceae bacterium]
MKIKKLLALLLAVFMLAAISACSSNNSQNSSSPDGEDETLPREDVRLTFATGGTGGTYYPYGGAIAMVLDDETGYIKANVIATGASAENVQLIGAGEAHLALVQNDTLDYAYNATNTWTAEAVTNLATLMTLYPEVCQIIVTADSDIYSVSDLAGKRVSTGDIGSGVEANAIQILEAYGMTVDDIRQESLSFAASADAMKDRVIDAFFVTAGTPNTAVLDLQTSRELRIISIDNDIMDELIAKYPFYAKYTITTEEYSFLHDDVDTVAVQATLICSPDLDEAVAYDIVKAILDGKDDLIEAHAKGIFIDAEYAVQGVSVPFHPGAQKYFEEIGVLG